MTLLGAFVARMLNTCSIGRRWKSREGWSRPVLTGERGTLFPIPFGGSGLVLWWFSRWMARNAVSCGHDDDTGKAFDLLASVVRFPDRHDRNRSCGWFRCRPPVFPVGRSEWFCGGHGPGETPGPFPNPEAKAWHGDGTALERVWESSAPPHSTVWTFWSSPLWDSRKVFFYSHGVFSSGRWGTIDVGKPVRGRIPPVGGGFRTVEGLWTYWLFQ